jgi:hypothetical protein
MIQRFVDEVGMMTTVVSHLRRQCACCHVTESWGMRCHHSCTAESFDALLLQTKYIMLILYAKIFFETRNGGGQDKGHG